MGCGEKGAGLIVFEKSVYGLHGAHAFVRITSPVSIWPVISVCLVTRACPPHHEMDTGNVLSGVGVPCSKHPRTARIGKLSACLKVV